MKLPLILDVINTPFICSFGHDLSSLQKKIIMDVEQMNDDELRALYTFIDKRSRLALRWGIFFLICLGMNPWKRLRMR
jgi:hypothetical protein